MPYIGNKKILSHCVMGQDFLMVQPLYGVTAHTRAGRPVAPLMLG